MIIPDELVEQTILFHEPLFAALPANHLLAESELTLKELAENPMILYPAGTSSTPTFADICSSLFTSRGLTLNVTQQVNDLQTALGLVASEMDVTLVSEQVNRLKRDDVVFIPLQDKSITSPVIFSRRKGPMDDITKSTMDILNTLIESR
ncbi:LysR family transcriptional regulator [Marinomonas ushuaiensis DSM 15871]|uniref:LysR family transcriptional regulator n=1 Tax=Marinomonas ushuaiensis DSM 15871 TaxID=1122207 RepID=X7E3P2_9GAMM|nr:LysR substrate-binding domain-containing protein [Marinomonas ushuaiensis]ETX09786.1 LysR family transcriptional regulator [Marinomonas ushuaiensis DSM 15871]